MAKILYIEDIQDNITLVEKIVRARGHECSLGASESHLEVIKNNEQPID